eukprot:GHUV01002189.1.p1 GENE.GHUV01002189.1~~GHUV01002189.1.p1  ORF type:complete len:210 (+),score=29.78 GHUV01002189.1:92-721(+)
MRVPEAVSLVATLMWSIRRQTVRGCRSCAREQLITQLVIIWSQHRKQVRKHLYVDFLIDVTCADKTTHRAPASSHQSLRQLPQAVSTSTTQNMAAAQDSAFSASAQTGFDGKDAAYGTETMTAQASIPSSKSYKLVKSETGNNLYVETKEYDPLAHHRPHDKAHNKGQGLGFMLCCFGGKSPKDEDTRFGYELPPADSAALQESKTPSS